MALALALALYPLAAAGWSAERDHRGLQVEPREVRAGAEQRGRLLVATFVHAASSAAASHTHVEAQVEAQRTTQLRHGVWALLFLFYTSKTHTHTKLPDSSGL